MGFWITDLLKANHDFFGFKEELADLKRAVENLQTCVTIICEKCSAELMRVLRGSSYKGPSPTCSCEKEKSNGE